MDMSQFYEQLKSNGVELSDHQIAQFNQYYQILVEWNKKNEFNRDYRKGRSICQTFL